VQLVVGDADEAFREAAAALAPLANVTSVVAPPNAGDSAYVHSALCYAHALDLCSQHARRALLHFLSVLRARRSYACVAERGV